MKSTFADSYYFMAILSRNDHAHERAMAALDRLAGRLITTEFVLLEVGDAYSDPRDRSSFLELAEQLATDFNRFPASKTPHAATNADQDENTNPINAATIALP